MVLGRAGERACLQTVQPLQQQVRCPLRQSCLQRAVVVVMVDRLRHLEVDVACIHLGDHLH
jgi:hypothetical protein